MFQLEARGVLIVLPSALELGQTITVFFPPDIPITTAKMISAAPMIMLINTATMPMTNKTTLTRPLSDTAFPLLEAEVSKLLQAGQTQDNEILRLTEEQAERRELLRTTDGFERR